MSHTNGKNLLVIHLESISRANLWQFRNELGTVWRLMSNSLQFNRFFTNSVSTTMTVSDLFSGDSSIKDACTTFEASKKYFHPGKLRRFGQEFINRGHRHFQFSSSQYSSIREIVTADMVAYNNPDIGFLCEKALFHMAETKKAKRPFFAYFWDASSHLAYVSQHKDNVPGVADKLRVAYSLIDASLNRLLAGMAELGLWEDTIIVGFGDHGDEPWSHGLNRGYCHSLPPYASVTWTPMFIHDQGRFEDGITSQLASTIDLVPTLFGLIFPDEPPFAKLSPFAGINLFQEERDIAFSQNMFALQRELSDPEKGMIKGYAATNGKYRLLVFSGGPRPAEGGMALYCDQADPSNSLNLLKFFKMDRNGDISQFVRPPGAVSNQFTAVFGTSQVAAIQEAFNRLKPALLRHIKDKEESALAEYRLILEAPADEVAMQFAEGANRINSINRTPDVFLPFVLLCKKLFNRAKPQLFPDTAFTQIKKAP